MHFDRVDIAVRILAHKSRFIGKGFSQTYGRDYKESYSEVLAQVSLQFIIRIAVNNRWKSIRKSPVP